jgi:hypothetical protein
VDDPIGAGRALVWGRHGARAQAGDGGLPVQPVAANPGGADAPSQLIREGFDADAGVDDAPEVVEAAAVAPPPAPAKNDEAGAGLDVTAALGASARVS